MTAPLLLLLLPFEEEAEWLECILAKVPEGDELDPIKLLVPGAQGCCCLLVLTAPMLLFWPAVVILPSKSRRGTPLKFLNERVHKCEYLF